MVKKLKAIYRTFRSGMHRYKSEGGEGVGKEDFLERYVFFFHNQQGCKIFFSNLENLFLLPLQCRILFPYILVLHDFFPVYGLSLPPFTFLMAHP